jgi:hypothetical protein
MFLIKKKFTKRHNNNLIEEGELGKYCSIGIFLAFILWGIIKLVECCS